VSRRAWWIAGAVVAVAACVAVAAWVFVLPKGSQSDCSTVRAMIAYNKQHNEVIASKTDLDAGKQPALSDYQEWATRLRGLANQVNDSQLSAGAHKLADLADKTVDVVQLSRNDTSAPADPNPPQWAQDAARINQEFVAEQVELDKTCPG
jgi:hypothetical protein